MTEQQKRASLADVPDLSKVEEKGISIYAPTPTQFSIPDPWTGSPNGSAEGDSGPPGADPTPAPADPE
jgi:hypothetical protein